MSDPIKITKFIKNILKTTKSQTEQIIRQYCGSNCDQTRKMKVVSQIADNCYMVQYNGKQYKAFSRYNNKIGDTVLVTICCGDFNNLIIN